MKLAEIGLTGTDLTYTDLINTDPLDDNLIEILDSSIETGDFSTFFDILKSENSYLKLLYGIYSKINNYVSKFCHDLYSSQILVANALQLLTELIQVYGIREIQCLKLSRTILSLIIDEHCSINNIKRAVNVLNSLVKKQSVISSLIQDDSLEGSLQIFGRKIPEIGDYECQALLYEALYRITCDKNREYWANVWFLDPVAKNMFLSLDPGRFETNCRAALNYINRNELDRRVFSVIAYCVSFGSFELKQPSGSEFWIDFNYGSQSISFYCSELSVNDSLNDSDLWETILINNPSVTSYYIEENEAEKVKVVTLILNCPCQNLMTCSVISNPAFNSFEIKLSFRGLYDVYTHLEAIYGREKFKIGPLPKKPKVSDCTDVIKCSDIFENGTAEALSCEISSKRKISDSCLIIIKNEENEDVIPETEEAQPLARIFESSEPLKIPKVEHIENIQYETHLAKKIYNSEPIPLTSIPEIEAFQDSNVPPRFSEIINSAKRKVSCCSVNIKINDDYEHQVIECQERQKDEQTMSQGKKAKLTNSSSLDNNSSAALVKGIIDKTRSDTELQSNLKSCTNTFMSSVAHINSIDICTSKYGKKDFSEENVDSYSAGIYDKKEAIDSVHKNKTKVNGYSDERNSVTSDVFSDVSMIEDSQTKTHGSVEKSEHYLRNRLKRPSSAPLQLPTAPKEKVLRRTSSMPAAYYSNGFHESPEDDYEIIPCSKNIKLSMPNSEKNEGQERQSNVEKKRKKRKTRRRSRRISDRKISQTSKTSSSSPDNINIKNLKPLEDKKNSANEGRQKKVCNMKEQIRKPINSVNIPTDNNISTSEMHRNDNPSLRKHYSDLNHTLNLTDRNSSEKIQKEISDESCVILDENVVVVEDSFNEKRYPEKSMQEEENKSSSSPKETSEEKSVHLSPAVCLQNQEGTSLTCIGKITKNDGKKSPSEKPKTHSVPNITSSKSEEDDSKVCGINNESQVPYKESGESSKGTTNSESAPKKQPPKKRLYNLDNAPVFDVPPSKFSNKSPKRGFPNHPVWNLNTDEQDNFEDNRVPNCDRKNVSNINKNNNLRISDDKLKIYDRIAESDEDFQEHNNRDLNETRKRSRTMPQRKKPSKKKKTEVSQSDKIVKSTRTRREAAVKAMKVNKRILDPAPEVACDEIKVMGESDDSPENTAHKPEKKRKYSKVFGSSRHSSTETGSSEVSWLKKPCRLFESPKRSYSQWKKTLKKKSLPVKNLPVKSLPVKSLPAKSLPIKVVSASKPISKKTYHNVSTETGSKSKSMNWSDLENFNLTVEKNAKKSYPVLHDLENHMKSLSVTSHNRNDKDLSSNNRPFQISSLHSKHASDESNVLEQYNEPNNNYDTACDNDQYNDSSERYNYRDNHDISDYHEDMHEMKRNGKRKSTNTYITSDEVATLKSLAKSTTLVPQSVETYDSLHKERGSERSQSLPPEDECYSQFDTNENIPFKDFGNETKGKQLHLQRFLECAVRYSESQKSSSLPNMNSSLDQSRDNAESAKSHETVNEVITSKSDELQMSRTRWKNEKHKYSTDIDTLKKTTVEDLVKENSKYFKDCTIDELTLRKSVDLVPQGDKSVKSFEMKRKKTYCGSEEKMVERHQKKSKLNENLTLLKNCTIDSLTLMHSSGHSGDEKSSKNMDNYGFTNKISRKDRDFRNSELNRSRSLTKKSTLKSNSILNNSRLSTVSFKETEADNNWFSRITFQLSQDADTMARRLLATVQKCFYDFSTKMCFLRENIIKTTETFEMSSVQNINISKLKNLIQTCRVIRAEVEKSLKAMEMTGKEYFETEEKHYRKLRHKYIKACKKYMSSMENAKNNAIHNLEGNVILKAKSFFRKFLKYMDTA